jgi:hypothetical protein
MSILNIDAEISIANVVEAMLPRFSDHKLGLHISLDINFFDHGYGRDGNTIERKELDVRRSPHLLFVRPSNYTQVYFFEDNKKYTLNPCNIWKQTSDHDSCWRSDGFRDLTDIYFQCAKKFDGREVSGVPMRPCDIHYFHHMDEPKYVQLITHEQVNKKEVYGEKSWDYRIEFEDIDRDELEVIGYMDKNYRSETQKFFSGMLIKGSEDHKHYMERKEKKIA